MNTTESATDKPTPQWSEAHLKNGLSVKLKELEALLEKLADSKSVENLAKDFSRYRELSGLRGLAVRLFARAPRWFLEERSSEELSQISTQAFETLVEWSKRGAQEILIKHLRHRERDLFFVVLKDRPFIINTINSCSEGEGVAISPLLHPILFSKSDPVSFCFFEIDPAHVERIPRFKSQLDAALRALVKVTDDFIPMKQALLDSLKVVRFTAEGDKAKAQPEELTAFLSWLTEENFVFEGYSRWRISSVQALSESPEQILGLFCSTLRYADTLLKETREDAKRALAHKDSLSISISSLVSPVHHRGRLMHLLITERDAAGQAKITHSFVGQFSSKALREEASSVPLIRHKLKRVVERQGLLPNSYLFKTAKSLVDTMPKLEALVLEEEQLSRDLSYLLGWENEPETDAFIRFEPSKRGAFVLIVTPSENFSNSMMREITSYLGQVFRASSPSFDCHVSSLDHDMSRIYIYVPFLEQTPVFPRMEEIEDGLVQRAKGWKESLQEALPDSIPHGDSLITKYDQAFSEEYQTVHSVTEALADISIIETLKDADSIRVRVERDTEATPHAGTNAQLVISVFKRGAEIFLGQSLPYLEHAGFDVLHEQAYLVSPRGSEQIFIHRFPVRVRNVEGVQLSEEDLTRIARGLEEVFVQKLEDDPLNALMVRAGLTTEQVALLRTFTRLLWQMKKFATRQTIRDALVENSFLARDFCEIFDLKFNPRRDIPLSPRKAEVELRYEQFKEKLKAVRDITYDRILRALLSILQATVRTNYYIPHGAVALKIHSENLDILSLPRPLFEIFVSATSFEGIHLRSSRIARGGIRWSDRRDDFRSEVRDLMKTQQVKNVLIVPTGAKGGFVVKEVPQDRNAAAEAVKSCYQDFIRALLSVSDNRLDDKIVRHDDLIVYDEDDPYLVVAADKGTATFSDVANKIAVEEFNFWLGDAFASGGSNGYDHKKLGITANGAWEAVKEHFKEIKLDYEATPFSVIGIGDMSGDVFGNGLLYSDKIKLLGAFNHKHIFIDPTPDPAKSFIERKRLFELPYSQWSDYRADLISRGGGVFDRTQKEIQLSPEARRALGIGSEVPQSVSAEQLISLLLKAPCDLLWNGGIGTYVKASEESDTDVNDASNDRVRINASELRARIVSEGGNLGFTQRARIEFAKRGGLINTDAIDNSGGVDTSDHEVNLKILLDLLVHQKKINQKERAELLVKMSDDVVKDVLSHNKGQASLIASTVSRTTRNLEYFKSLISELVRRGYVHRTVHQLPSDEEIQERGRTNTGLTRPELAICLAGVKMLVKEELLASELIKEPILKRRLFDYIPAVLGKRFEQETLSHPLGDHLVATIITNQIVETVGLTFVHRMCLSHSTTPRQVLTALLAAHTLLEVPQVLLAIEPLDKFESTALYRELRLEVSAGLREATSWMIANPSDANSCESLVAEYQKGLSLLLKQGDSALYGTLKGYYQERYDRIKPKVPSENLAGLFTPLPMLPLYFEILWCSRKTKVDAELAAKTFCWTLDALGLFPILTAQRSVAVQSKWEHELRLNSYEEIRRSISSISCALLERGSRSEAEVQQALARSANYLSFRTTAGEFAGKIPHVAALGVFARQLRQLRI